MLWFGKCTRCQELADGAENQGKRSAEFVTDVGEELGLQLIELAELFI